MQPSDDAIESLRTLVIRWRDNEQTYSRQAERATGTYAERLATKADTFGICADQLAERLDSVLMASAPEMLKALETTAGNIRSLGPAGALHESYTEWLRVVEAAIAKAEGR